MILQLLFAGVITGSVYALVAIGYTLIYGVLKFINFAHGEICAVGAFLAYSFNKQLGVPFAPAVLLSIILTSLLGIGADKIAYRPLRRSHRLILLISAIGISVILRNAIALVYGSYVRSLRGYALPRVYSFAGVNFTSIQIAIIASSVVFMFLLHLFLSRTRQGRAIRATSEDPEIASIFGVKTEGAISLTFGIASGLAAFGGIFIALEHDLDPNMGVMLGFKAFTASVIGGIGNVPGAMLGGYLLGLIENLSAGYISSRYKDAITLCILIGMLIARPHGLLRRREG
ncbi:TPA: branched-chain amino acid ABC transporter permease [Candidatus Poribacteria bacterium]|nr:branched-chain amino acid ABC transporter permease [Candidatus Poribacteria bacterium]HEX28885.1 branched-chain amino acid ABC transporter permease [Candidatus Poribacteria bacterium]